MNTVHTHRSIYWLRSLGGAVLVFSSLTATRAAQDSPRNSRLSARCAADGSRR